MNKLTVATVAAVIASTISAMAQSTDPDAQAQIDLLKSQVQLLIEAQNAPAPDEKIYTYMFEGIPQMPDLVCQAVSETATNCIPIISDKEDDEVDIVITCENGTHDGVQYTSNILFVGTDNCRVDFTQQEVLQIGGEGEITVDVR